MPHGPWDWVFCAAALAVPLGFALRKSRRELAFLLALIHLIALATVALVWPEAAPPGAVVGLVAVDLALAGAWRGHETAIRARVRSRAFLAGFTVAFLLVVPLGLLERGCRLLSDLGLLKYHRAIQTVWRAGDDDWRMATITGDENREPDPVLLWRPVARKPFSSQRFKGPEVAVPKPAGVVRVMCYGDSLTDGPPKGGWPTWLGAILEHRFPGRKCEVLNAGVAGYSSHQGLLRFLQEVDRYQPDLLIASYGWNDAAQAAGEADKDFKIPPWPFVMGQRLLVRYRAYLVLMEYTRRLRPSPPAALAYERRPRVSRADYLANLARFEVEARKRGVPILFLTRPHKLEPTVLAQSPGWRGEVPGYNDALRAWARERGAPLIDAQAYFQTMPPEIFSDECHLWPAGYEALARLVASAIHPRPDGSIEVVAEAVAARPGGTVR